MFHRLTVPTYSGGLPVGYDYINTPSDPSVGGTGVPSFMDSKKVGGPNDGTYLIAFGEDATSSFANRGMKALAQNTDALDDLMRRDLALTARTADVLAGAPVSSFTLAGQVFVGENGVTNNQAQRDLLVSVLDSNDNEIIDAAGAKVVASLIHNGASVNVVGTQVSGFYNTPTVNLNTAIPAGTTYRVYYGERGNLATLPKDAFTTIKIRGAQEVSAEVERTLRDLHKASGATWNDAWLANINSLARTGLDGRYRLTTVDPGSSPVVDTPGNGATITRDGRAVTMSAPTYLLNAYGTVGVNAYPDPVLACFRVQRASPTVTTTFDTTRGGDVGLMQESPYHTTGDANEVAYGHVTGPLLLDMIPRSITASTLTSDAVLTRIGANNIAIANPDGLTDADSRRTLQVNASDFTRDGSGRTALRKTDLVEIINNATGLVVGTFRVDTVTGASRFTVKALTGALPPLGPSGSPANVKIRWLQPTVSIGGRLSEGDGGSYGIPHFMVAAPGMLVSDWDANFTRLPGVFLAAATQRSLGISNANLFSAMGWGGFDTSGAWIVNGVLEGDGGIICSGGRQKMMVISRTRVGFLLITGGGSISWNPYTGGLVDLQSSGALTAATAYTFAVNTSLGFTPTDGDSFVLFVRIQPGSPGPLSITWPVDFIFSGTDGVVPSSNLTATEIGVKYQFTYNTRGGGSAWYATRTDY